jgi:hypothetical protein
LTALHRAGAWARDCFQAANYDRLAAGLPRLIGVAVTTRDSANGDERATASALLADAYIAAASLVVKLKDDAFGWTGQSGAAGSPRQERVAHHRSRAPGRRH